MVNFSILVPDATVNYIENPNCRYDTTGYNAAGATLTRSLDYARFGIASCQVVTAGSALREGMFYRVNSLQGLSGPLTVSVYVIGTGSVRARLIDNPTGKEWTSENVTLRADRWTRLSVTGTVTGSNDVRLYVETNEGTAKARTFYVGGLQMERKAYVTTFCDGDQPGCRWNGIYHSSSSQRSGETRAGGRWVQLAGTERQEQDLYMTVAGGLGFAGLKNHIQSFALSAGANFQNSRVLERLITLTFHARHTEVTRRDCEVSLAALHQLRQLVIDVVKPDRTGGDEDIWFQYDDGDTPLFFQARYDGGLEGSWDVRNEWVNSFPLRLLAVSPSFYEDQQMVKQLDIQNQVSMQHALARVNGAWSNLNSGVNGHITTMAIGPKGQIYIAGYFTIANNAAGAVNPLIPAAVAYWDGQKWVAIASSVDITGIDAMGVAANGDLYVSGNFTTIHGVAANRIAKYTVSTGTWSALGTGLNAAAGAIAIAPNGDVYVGGLFAIAGGVSCARIARWDGLQWRRLGQYGGLNSTVSTIAITQDGNTLYVGGFFTGENGGGATLNLVAQYDISAGTFSAMGNGITGTEVSALLIANNNILYAGGLFTASGSDSLSNIAQWNGVNWTGLGEGLDQQVYELDILRSGFLLASGKFNNSGSLPVSKVALFNGSNWLNLDVYIPTTLTEIIYVVKVDRRNDDIYLGGISTAGALQVLVSGLTMVNNPGTQETHPKIYVLGPGTLYWIENQSNKKRIYLNLMALNGEEIVFDTARGTIESTVRGSLLYVMLPGSDFKSFTLLPGNNTLATFMIKDVGAKMQIGFTPQHWSVDATQNAESL